MDPGKEFRYAGLWVRLAAYALDIVLFIPYILFARLLAYRSPAGFVESQVTGLAISLVWAIHLVRLFGGSPGKRILRLRIATLDGGRVGYREAWIRYSVWGVTTTLTSYGLASGALKISDDEFRAADTHLRLERIRQEAPAWYQPLQVAGSIWIGSDIIALLANRKRRALHDLLAGTIVIREGA